MVWLLLAFTLVIMIMVVVLGSSGKIDSKEKGQKDKQNIKEQKILQLENENSSLKQALEKASLEYFLAQSQWEEEKKKEEVLREKSEKLKIWYDKHEGELERLKKENAILIEKIASKVQEHSRVFSPNISSNKDFKEMEEKLKRLDKENKETLMEVVFLKAQEEKYKKEIESKNKFLDELKTKEEESSWVSRAEYDQLNEQLEVKNELLKKIQADKNRIPPKAV